MEIRDVFDQMNEKLDHISYKIKTDNVKQEQVEPEIEKLKAQSEEIVEEWLKFEEKLGNLLSQEINHHEHHSNEWKKGKALYDLLMFDQAIDYLEQVIQLDPEFEPAKIYLAHSHIATNQLDKAKYHLQFLIETSESKDILHLSLHALGCVEGMRHEYEKANHFFEKINVEQVRKEWRSVFSYNHAQTLYALERYSECLDQLVSYYHLEPSDWQGPFLIGRVCMEMGDEESALAFWFEALQIQENVFLLKEMAKHFEKKTYYQMAAQCYERILKEEKLCMDEQVWLGLSWNYGLAQQEDKSYEMYIRALSLFPHHLELQISYTWMLLLWNKPQKAKGSIVKLQQRHPQHPLVKGLVYLYAGQYDEAVDLFTQLS